MAEDPNRLVEANLPLVRNIAVHVARALGLKMDLEDLVAYGMRGLVEAAGRFDRRRGFAFTTFAYYRVRGAMYDGLREMGGVPRRVTEKIRFLEGADAYLAGIDPRADAREPAAAAARVASVAADLAALYTLNAASSGVEPATPAVADADVERKRTEEKVRHAMASLPRREAEILRLCYFEDLTLENAGARLKLSKSWASRLHARAIKLLRERICIGSERVTRRTQPLRGPGR